MRRVLNLGAGTQSSVLYLMIAGGELPAAEVAIFADTGWEPPAVYEQLKWLEREGGGRLPVARVSAGNIREDGMVSVMRGRRKDGTRWVSLPMYVSSRRPARTPPPPAPRPGAFSFGGSARPRPGPGPAPPRDFSLRIGPPPPRRRDRTHLPRGRLPPQESSVATTKKRTAKKPAAKRPAKKTAKKPAAAERGRTGASPAGKPAAAAPNRPAAPASASAAVRPTRAHEPRPPRHPITPALTAAIPESLDPGLTEVGAAILAVLADPECARMTVKDKAALAGITDRTWRRYMADPDFVGRVNDVARVMLRGAVGPVMDRLAQCALSYEPSASADRRLFCDVLGLTGPSSVIAIKNEIARADAGGEGGVRPAEEVAEALLADGRPLPPALRFKLTGILLA